MFHVLARLWIALYERDLSLISDCFFQRSCQKNCILYSGHRCTTRWCENDRLTNRSNLNSTNTFFFYYIIALVIWNVWSKQHFKLPNDRIVCMCIRLKQIHAWFNLQKLDTCLELTLPVSSVRNRESWSKFEQWNILSIVLCNNIILKAVKQ